MTYAEINNAISAWTLAKNIEKHGPTGMSPRGKAFWKNNDCPGFGAGGAEIDMPSLTGVSEAQIAYGRDKRAETLKDIFIMDDYRSYLDANQVFADKVANLISERTDAKFWIDNSAFAIVKSVAEAD
jgi:hypothetical protein